MKKWVLKAIVQKGISYLPYSNKINYVFQKYVTKGVFLSDEYFYDRLGHAKTHLEAYAQQVGGVPHNALELGTGWYPIAPFAFFLSGVETVYSVDISFLTSKERIKTTLSKFIEAKEKNILNDYLTVLPKRWQILNDTYENIENLSLAEVLQRLHLEYKIEDARKLSFADNSIDLVNSNNTFEHIYPVLLIPILKEFKRVCKKNGGVQSHFIDMSDHFAHFDKTINIYNFLQFSEKQWEKIDNSIQPQSRLRIDDYKKIYADLDIPITSESHRPGDIEAAKAVALDQCYAQKPIDIVAISHCHFVSAGV